MEKESADDVKLISKYEDDEIGSEMTMNFIEIKNDFSVLLYHNYVAYAT